jgi:hypothetical protein
MQFPRCPRCGADNDTGVFCPCGQEENEPDTITSQPMNTSATSTGRPLTRTIAGHALTLTAGRRYLASRPMISSRLMASQAARGRVRFDVKITDITDGYAIDAKPAAVVPGLGYEEANEVLRRFNNGETSFEGRVWG